tara:strand:- start:139 stop:279 length:141 start_codon:yes stop_codon:yes gene_type:complete
MLYKLSRYLKKKGISDAEFIKIALIIGVSSTMIVFMLYGAIGALIL